MPAINRPVLDAQAMERAAKKAWAEYSAAVPNIPWRTGPVSRTAFIDGYCMALEFPPEHLRNRTFS